MGKKRESARQSAKIVITKPTKTEYKDISEPDTPTIDNNNIQNTASLVGASALITPIPPTPTLTPKPQHRRGGVGGVGNLIGSVGVVNTINPLDAQSALLLSHSDFRTVQGKKEN